MSQNPRFTVDRLMGRAHRPGSPEETAARHLYSAANRPVPGAVALARVRGRLNASLSRRSGSPWRWKTIVAVFALGMSLGGATAAAIWRVLPGITKRASATAAPVRPVDRIGRARARAPEAPLPVVSPPLPETRAVSDGVALARPIAAAPSARKPSPSAPIAPAMALVAPTQAGRPLRHPSTGDTVVTAHEVVPVPVVSSTTNVRSSDANVAPPLSSTAAPALARVDSSSVSVGAAPHARTTVASRDLAEEARLLGLALQQLHRDHDARASLKTLDEHAARFSGTTLKPEADLTRVEALLALDRRGDALVVLDGMWLTATSRGRSLAVVRGELRAGAQRCPEAIPDFSQVLDVSPADTLAEKALHGRIACLISIGENGAARADAQTYLERFPSGRFASEVRRVLTSADRH